MRLQELAAILVVSVFIQSSLLWAAEETDGSQGGTFPQKRYSDIDQANPATDEGTTSMDLGEASITRLLLGPLKVNDTELLMKPHAGGKFGLFSDWRDSVAIPGLEDDEPQLRGGVCETDAMKERVQVILERRSKTPADSKVAACIRSKDYGRFLPEWVAFHYALGVDEVMIFDDDSVDRTAQALLPFIDAGIVKYQLGKIIYKMQMKPLNDCLKHYIDKRNSDQHAPRWILFHDADEYIFPVNTDRSLPEALGVYNSICCTLVPRVQYGSGNRIETPRGLVLENFLTHVNPADHAANRLPKVMVNLDPSEPEKGVLDPRLPSMHNAHGCTCDRVNITDMRINHYLRSRGDFYDHTRRYWEGRLEMQSTELKLSIRDINDETSDTITHWACATREILYRVVNRLDLETGL